MPYFMMVRMEFTCILLTKTFLVGLYWDFNDSEFRSFELRAFVDDKYIICNSYNVICYAKG